MNSDVAAAIEQIMQRLVDSWNSHDAHGFAANFAEDADFTNVFGMKAKGREAIERFHRPMFETMFRDSRVMLGEIQARLIRPDVAAVDVRWAMTGARDPSGAEWPRRVGLMNLLVTFEAGGWSIAVMHNMDLPDQQQVDSLLSLQAGAN